jgi:hypothetical protein
MTIYNLQERDEGICRAADLGAVLDAGELLQRAVRQDALEQLHLDAVDAAHVAEVVDELLDAHVQQAPRLPPGLHPPATAKLAAPRTREEQLDRSIDLAPPGTKETNSYFNRPNQGRGQAYGSD